MAAALPDHYRTLGVPADAPADAVKKAYRALARQYHPDAAPDNPFAEARFRTVQEAYAVLSDPAARRRYDSDRWLSGATRHRDKEPLSAALLLRDARRLSAHLQRVSADDLNHRALHDVLLFLLSDEHLAVLRTPDMGGNRVYFLEELLHATHRLRPRYVMSLASRLAHAAPADARLQARVALLEAGARKSLWWSRRLSWLLMGLAVVLCWAIWWLAKL